MEVQKNEMFELMMLFNRKNFLKEFSKKKNESTTYDNIKKNMYIFGHLEKNISPLSKIEIIYKSILMKTIWKTQKQQKLRDKKQSPSTITVSTSDRHSN